MPYQKQILKDTSTEVTIKFTGIIDAVGPTLDGPNTTLILSMLNGAKDTNGANRLVTGGAPLPFYGISIRSVDYTFGGSLANGSIGLAWRGATSNSVAMWLPNGQLNIDLKEGMGPIVWDAVGTGANSGELFITANGVPLGAFTVIVHARKDPRHFDRGYNTDPHSFSNP